MSIPNPPPHVNRRPVRRTDGGYATFPNRWVDAGYMEKAPGSVTQVYLFLCRWADNTSHEAEQAIRMIATKCGLSANSVTSALRTLERWGAITLEGRANDNAPNTWVLNELREKAPPLPPKTGGSPSPQKLGGHYQPDSYQTGSPVSGERPEGGEPFGSRAHVDSNGPDGMIEIPNPAPSGWAWKNGPMPEGQWPTGDALAFPGTDEEE